MKNTSTEAAMSRRGAAMRRNAGPVVGPLLGRRRSSEGYTKGTMDAFKSAKSSMENLERSDAVQVSSERSFGIVFTVVFALIALLPLFHGEPLRQWALAVAVVFL